MNFNAPTPAALDRERVTEERVTLSPGTMIRLVHLRRLMAATAHLAPDALVYVERTTPVSGSTSAVWLETVVVKDRTPLPLEKETSDE